MKVNIKSIVILRVIIAAIIFVLFLTGSMLVVNKCTGSSNDIAIVGDTLTCQCHDDGFLCAGSTFALKIAEF